MVILLVYVDDILITGSSSTLIEQLMQDLNGQFSLKNLGAVSYFLGIQISRQPDLMHL